MASSSDCPIVRYEFWNGQTSRKKKYLSYEGLVTTKHNPCLWTNVGAVCSECCSSVKQLTKEEEQDVAATTSSCPSCKPWRGVYTLASEVLDRWEAGNLDDTDLLHHLRYVAYGVGKRTFDNTEVVWPGNLTPTHRPKLSVEREDGSKYTIRFEKNKDEGDGGCEDPTRGWTATREQGATFYWPL